MTELRWLLLAIGIIILGGVYFFWGRSLKLPKLGKTKGDAIRAEPSMDSEFVDYLDGRDEPALSNSESPALQEPSQESSQSGKKIISLHVAASGANRFPGNALLQTLTQGGFTHGKFDIFHRYQDGREDQVLYSVANMLEPGSFDPATMDTLLTPGVTMFLVLPGPIDGVQVFSDMLESAKQIAAALGGEVLDQQGSTMSNQAASHLREEIIAFQLQQSRKSY